MTEIFDPTSAIGSASAGFVCTIITSFFKQQMERETHLINILAQATKLQDDSADLASSRDGNVGKWIRRGIYFCCAFTICVAPFLFAFFPNIPVEVETKEVCGGYLFGLIPEWTETTFKTIQGFYLPESIQKAFISYLIPFYLGRGVAK